MNKRIKEIRKSIQPKGLTMDKFGERLGVSKVAVSQWESGTNQVSSQMVRSICREFNVNEDWLRTGEGEMFNEISRDEEIATFIGRIQMNESNSFKKRFIAALSKLDESEWEVLEKFISDMIEKKD